MKTWMLAVIFLSSLHAFADQTDKVEDLSTEVEAEQIDVYDHQMLDQQARKEAEALESESRSLEAQMRQLRQEGQTLSKRVGHEQEHYTKVAKLNRESTAQARKLEVQRNSIKSQVETLHAKSEQMKNRLQSAVELNRSLIKGIGDLRREKDQLIARQHLAELKIQKAAQDTKRLRAQQHRLSEDNGRLQQKWASSEQ